LEKLIAEHGEKGLISHEKVLFVKSDIPVPDSTGVTACPHACNLNYFRVILFQNLRKNIRGAGNSRIARIAGFLEDNPAEAVAVGMEGIVVELIVGPEKDQDEAGHPHGEACDINEEIPFVSPDVPESGL
jgi:hypothetical protein